MITGSWCLLPVLSHNQKKEGVHSHFSDEKMEAYEGDAHGFKDTADPRQPHDLPGQEVKALGRGGICMRGPVLSAHGGPAWGEAQGCEGRGGGAAALTHHFLPLMSCCCTV